MHLEDLTVSVIYGSGAQCPELRQMLENLPHLRVIEQSADPQEFLSQDQDSASDLVMVNLNGDHQVPEWLGRLTSSRPLTPVLLCSHAQSPEFLIKAIQAGIREYLPLPMSQADLEAALARIWVVKQRLQAPQHLRGRVVVVTGHKGGAGATSVAVNLALALGEQCSQRLALVDLGRPFPDVGNFLDVEPNYTIFDLSQNLQDLDQTYIQRIMQPYGDKLAILHGSADFKEQDCLDLESLEKIFKILRSAYRWVVVDLSHWLDSLFFQVVKEADTVLLLTELTIPDLRNLKRLFPILQEWSVKEKVKLVVNRSHKANGLQLRDLEQAAQQPVFYSLTSDYPALIKAVNQGTPLKEAAPRSKIYQDLQQLARMLVAETPEAGAEVEQAPRKFWNFSRR